jgi:glucosamine--fructose-6-phosphate aminotransferase (isomerizing)
VAIRNQSPLCIGISEQEKIIASDIIAFAGVAKQVLYMSEQSFAIITRNTIELYDFAGNSLDVLTEPLNIVYADNGKQGYEHFMLKEVYEQKDVIYATIAGLESGKQSYEQMLGLSADRIKSLKSLNLIGCGSSWHAARIAQFFFERIAGIQTKVFLASEFRYMPFFSESDAAYIAVSQSGETADTLEVMRLVRHHDAHVIALCNVATSTMVKESDGAIITRAGYEFAVASTKAFATQITALFWLSHLIAHEKQLISTEQFNAAISDILLVAEILQTMIERYKKNIETTLAPFYSNFKRYIFLGRHISYPFAMEAALKLKEVSYIFAQCYPAGELKHGPIALIDSETPLILFSTLDDIIYQKLVSNAQEIKARNGHLIIFAFEGQDELMQLADTVFIFPRVNPLLAPLAMTGLMQFFVYSIAKCLGRPIDKPRHLAKSVTVE